MNAASPPAPQRAGPKRARDPDLHTLSRALRALRHLLIGICQVEQLTRVSGLLMLSAMVLISTALLAAANTPIAPTAVSVTVDQR
jgi:hypothetical protein